MKKNSLENNSIDIVGRNITLKDRRGFNTYKKVKYMSLWDNGIEFNTNAKYDTLTGEVFDIEPILDGQWDYVSVINNESIYCNGKIQYIFTKAVDFIDRSFTSKAIDLDIQEFLNEYDGLEFFISDNYEEDNMYTIEIIGKEDRDNIILEVYTAYGENCLREVKKIALKYGIVFSYEN